MMAKALAAQSSKPEIDNSRLNPKRYRSLDHWRGIACLFVVINHATHPMWGSKMEPTPEVSAQQTVAVRLDETSTAHDKSPTADNVPKFVAAPAKLLVRLTKNMHFGVEMFFVISGYCITASAESLRRSGRNIGEYFKRRFLRIYPAFWCACLLSIVASFAIDRIYPGLLQRLPWPIVAPWDLTVMQSLGCFTLTHTWLCYLTGEPRVDFPDQSWTLCYEEQFYAVIGLLLVFSGSKFYRAVTMLTVSIIAIDVAAMIFDFPVGGFFFDEHWFMFAAGVGVYWKLNCATPRQSMIFQSTIVASIVGLMLLVSTTSVFGPGTHFSGMRLIGGLAFAQVLISLKRYDDRIMDLNWLGWLKTCGVMCYSIYLVHLIPVKAQGELLRIAGHSDDLSILFICIPLGLATSISLGYLFHVSVERRFLATRPGDLRGVEKCSLPSDRLQAVPASDPASLILSFPEQQRAIMDRHGDNEKVLDSPGKKVA